MSFILTLLLFGLTPEPVESVQPKATVCVERKSTKIQYIYNTDGTTTSITWFYIWYTDGYVRIVTAAIYNSIKVGDCR